MEHLDKIVEEVPEAAHKDVYKRQVKLHPQVTAELKVVVKEA